MSVVIAAALVCVVLVEVSMRVPAIAVVRRLLDVGQRARRVLVSNRISDHWKERVLLRYSWLMLLGSFELLAFLVLLSAIVYTAVVIAGWVHVDLFTFVLSWQGTTFCIAVATIYAAVRPSHA